MPNEATRTSACSDRGASGHRGRKLGRFVTNDFMAFGGGDGYTIFGNGTDVQQPGDELRQVANDYITAHSPVDPLVDGRILGP